MTEPMTRGTRRAVIFLFVFALALAAGNLVFTAREVSTVRVAEVRAASAAASVAQLCQSENRQGAKQVILWERLIAISKPPPHETAAQRRQRLTLTRAFLVILRQIFTPRNCTGRLGG